MLSDSLKILASAIFLTINSYTNVTYFPYDCDLFSYEISHYYLQWFVSYGCQTESQIDYDDFFYTYKCLNKSRVFSKLHYNTILGLCENVTPFSQVRTSTMFFTIYCGILKGRSNRLGYCLQRHNLHAKFCENRSVDSEAEWGNTRLHADPFKPRFLWQE